jgi:hypothetical protein
MRQMVWIALALLALVAGFVAAVSHNPRRGWGVANRRFVVRSPAEVPNGLKQLGAPPRSRGSSQRPPVWVTTYGRYLDDWHLTTAALPQPLPAAAIETALAGAFRAAADGSPFVYFARWVMFGLFLAFLLPLWSLSFATQAIGGEREDRSLVWLLTRPLPRWSIYIAKFIGVLPWTLAFNLGGFALICAAAGEPGRTAFRLFWPAVLAGSLAFAALFHLIGSVFRRPTVVALVYSFFLEVLLGDMPGLMKRVSISYYVRCLMFDAAVDHGLTPDKPHVYLPVSGPTAWAVLVTMTIALLVIGLVIFSRMEYRDDA